MFSTASKIFVKVEDGVHCSCSSHLIILTSPYSLARALFSESVPPFPPGTLILLPALNHLSLFKYLLKYYTILCSPSIRRTLPSRLHSARRIDLEYRFFAVTLPSAFRHGESHTVCACVPVHAVPIRQVSHHTNTPSNL